MPTLMKMHCNNVASKLSPAQCLAGAEAPFSGTGSRKQSALSALPAEARRALDEGVICDMFEGMRRTNRAMSYPITPVFWRTVRMAGAGRRERS